MERKTCKKGLDHKNWRVNTVKHPSGYRNHRYKLVDEPKKHPIRIFIQKIISNQSMNGL